MLYGESKGMMRRDKYILESVDEGVVEFDAEDKVTFINSAAAKMLGYRTDELLGKAEHALIHRHEADGTLHDDHNCPVCLARTTHASQLRRETLFWRKDGSRFPVEYCFSPLWDQGRFAGGVLAFRDLSERKQLDWQLHYLATRDTLTGLFNRSHFYKLLQSELYRAQQQQTSVALLSFDFDNFKDINDTLGHESGDGILQRVANIFKSELPQDAILARIGGDEFALLLPGSDLETAREVGQEIITLLAAKPLSIRKRQFFLRASIGVAMYPDHAGNAEDMLISADFGMYEAKQAGGNRVEVCTTPTPGRKRAEERLDWEHKIGEALRSGGFTLYWQPLLDLRRRQIAGYELLLRMKGRKGRVIGPQSFLPVAERSDLIHAIDRWVVHHAIQSLTEQSHVNDGAYVLHVNLSAKAFDDEQLLPTMRQELQRTGVDPSRLVLEITETAAIADLQRAKGFIDTLRSMGCRFALDDFGVGFTAFDTLRHLPVDFLKLDGCFVRNVSRDRVDRHLVRAMVEIARGLEKQTIAEFVPDEETLQLLAEYGVDYGQGYYIGRPQPLPLPASG